MSFGFKLAITGRQLSRFFGCVLVGAALAGCSSTGGGGGTSDPSIEGIACSVPDRCSEFYAKNEKALRSEMLRLFDQLEMASGDESNRRRQLVIDQQLEILLKECPRVVLPILIDQAQRPIHEIQRMNIAMVLGWFPEGRSCSEPVLVSMLADPLPLVRFSAAGALVDLGSQAGESVLVNEALESEDEHILQTALDALSKAAGRKLTTPEEARSWFATRG